MPLVLQPPEAHLLYLLWFLVNAVSGEVFQKSMGKDAVFGFVGNVMGDGGIVNQLDMFFIVFFMLFAQCFWNSLRHFDSWYLYQPFYLYLEVDLEILLCLIRLHFVDFVPLFWHFGYRGLTQAIPTWFSAFFDLRVLPLKFGCILFPVINNVK